MLVFHDNTDTINTQNRKKKKKDYMKEHAVEQKGKRQGTRKQRKCQKRDKRILAVCNITLQKRSTIGKATSSIQHLEQEPFSLQELTKSFKL